MDGAALTAPTYPVFSWKACADYCRTTTGCLGFKYRWVRWLCAMWVGMLASLQAATESTCDGHVSFEAHQKHCAR